MPCRKERRVTYELVPGLMLIFIHCAQITIVAKELEKTKRQRHLNQQEKCAAFVIQVYYSMHGYRQQKEDYEERGKREKKLQNIITLRRSTIF